MWADLDGQDSNALVTRYVRGNAIDQVFARIGSGGAAYWLLTDRQGSIRDVQESSTLNIKDTLTYDGWGNIASETDANFRGRYAWTGRELDVETGLQYNRARFYDPKVGRWISEDPLGFDAGDSNLYRYVNNHPAKSSDPSGLYVFFRERSTALDNLPAAYHAYLLTAKVHTSVFSYREYTVFALPPEFKGKSSRFTDFWVSPTEHRLYPEGFLEEFKKLELLPEDQTGLDEAIAKLRGQENVPGQKHPDRIGDGLWKPSKYKSSTATIAIGSRILKGLFGEPDGLLTADAAHLSIRYLEGDGVKGWHLWARLKDLGLKREKGKGIELLNLPSDKGATSVIRYSDDADWYLPVVVGGPDEVKKKWEQIRELARNYAFAEQSDEETGKYSGLTKNWPKSRYEILGNNSNTFVKYLIKKAGLGAPPPLLGNWKIAPGNPEPLDFSDPYRPPPPPGIGKRP